MPEIEWTHTSGLTPYPAALAAMTARVAAIRAGAAPERVWLLEHPPLYTAGTSARAADLRDAARFPTYAAGRGGQWTYHGPGQRIAYVMLDLTRRHGTVPARDIRAFVHGLEEWLIRALARLGIRGERRDGRIGIWVPDRAGGEAKIAALGVRVTRFVSCTASPSMSPPISVISPASCPAASPTTASPASPLSASRPIWRRRTRRWRRRSRRCSGGYKRKQAAVLLEKELFPPLGSACGAAAPRKREESLF